MSRKYEFEAVNNLYEYLVAHNSIYGRLPTNKELAYLFDKSPSTIGHQMATLVEQGKIERVTEVAYFKLKEN